MHEDALYFFEHGPSWLQKFVPIWVVHLGMVIIPLIALFPLTLSNLYLADEIENL